VITKNEAKQISSNVKTVRSATNAAALIKSLDQAYEKIRIAAEDGKSNCVIHPTQSEKADVALVLRQLDFDVVENLGGDLTVSW
jgi:hypothetical protein